MRKVVVVIVVVALALILGACSSPHKIQQRVSLERRDSLRAIFGEELTVCLDDFRIIPPDTCRPRVEARQVRVEHRREAAVAAESVVDEKVEVCQEPVTQPSKLWVAWVAAAVGFILGCLICWHR